MTKRMLIDATHPEETRVAVVNGSRLEEFDYETEFRKQLKGNIYLAKVTRVEPSLQAAFVEYGGNRHAFLPFPEIHSDYYRIPVSDRPHRDGGHVEVEHDDHDHDHEHDRDMQAEAAENEAYKDEPRDWQGDQPAMLEPHDDSDAISEAFDSVRREMADEDGDEEESSPEGDAAESHSQEEFRTHSDPFGDGDAMSGQGGHSDPFGDHAETTQPHGEAAQSAPARETETVGGDEVDEIRHSRRSSMPRYKIQEVIKRRQIMLIQVSKEERGNKGAAITTFLSLPGRYCVLMPNTPRGGGVSRKIANPQDRKRLKDLLGDLDLPDGMSVILRTAGVERTKPEIKRDLDYLMRLWEAIRTLTLKSTAPALVYEEGNLVKRSVRDIYSREIDELIVAGEAGYRQAKEFMRMLMPSHAKRVQFYRDPVPLFLRYQVESQIDAIHNPVAQLRSGGYVVINQTEALVSIDVNSGRSTRERNIEETAYKTNLEAADEIARQLRLRDMGGLVVIDFIDMEDPRHDAAVERRLKEAMKNDRARIQIGRMSPFGLLELSRQRLHPSLIESNFHTCPTCRGTGLVRSSESAAFMAMRAMEEEAIKGRAAEIVLHVPVPVALYILNHKRGAIAELERRYEMTVVINADDSLLLPDFRIERPRAHPPGFTPPALLQQLPEPVIEGVDEDIEDEDDETSSGGSDQTTAGGEAGAQEHGRRRRRRRGRRRGQFGAEGEGSESDGEGEGPEVDEAAEPTPGANDDQPDAAYPAHALEHPVPRGERGGRRRRGRGGRGRRPEGAPPDSENDPFGVQSDESGEFSREFSGETLIEAEENITAMPEAPLLEAVASDVAESTPPATRHQPEAVVEEPKPAAIAPERKRDFEVVNAAPETPRNGWWKRLIQ